MKVIPVNNNSLIKFKSLMSENDSDYEIKMKKIFETYLKRDEEIERLFENKLITFIEKLERKEVLINWRNEEEALLKKNFSNAIRKIKNNKMSL